MDRPASIGTTISAAGHLGLVAWIMLGGLLFRAQPSAPVALSEVSLMSEAEFAALAAAAARAPDTAEVPATPEAPAPEIQPEAPAPDAEPVSAAIETPEAPPIPVPPVEDPSAQVLPTISDTARPRLAPRVAPTPSETPAPDAAPAEAAVAEVQPDPAAEPVPEPLTEAAAPPEATTEIVTEATETDTTPESAAPATSIRPRAKPRRPDPVAVAEPPAPTPMPDPAAAADPLADALAEALAPEPAPEATPGTGTAASGPPMTSGEKDALILAVRQCWNVGALSTDALRTTVTIALTLSPDGRPDPGSIRMIGSEGGSEAAALQAFEAGRRALMRCAGTGYALPAEKYEQWREMEVIFNPEKMRLK